MYSGSFSSHRFSPLDADHAVERRRGCGRSWVYQPPGVGSVETTPIVANGVMYVTSGPTTWPRWI